MKNAYRIYPRKQSNGVYYIQNNSTGEQRSLKTKDRAKAEALLKKENDARTEVQAYLNFSTRFPFGFQITHSECPAFLIGRAGFLLRQLLTLSSIAHGVVSFCFNSDRV